MDNLYPWQQAPFVLDTGESTAGLSLGINLYPNLAVLGSALHQNTRFVSKKAENATSKSSLREAFKGKEGKE